MSSTAAKSPRTALVVTALLVMLLMTFQLRSCLVEYREIKTRPWAYSEDPAKKLLIGTWQGEFKDPAGVEKKLTLEILVPVTKEELEEKITRQHRRRVRPRDKRSFDGTATIQSRLGEELYAIYGSVAESDYHHFHLSFSPQDESKRVLPNYTARAFTEGKWDNDTMQAQLSFTHHNAEGFSSSTSEGEVVNGQVVWKEDPDEKPVSVELKRRISP